MLFGVDIYEWRWHEWPEGEWHRCEAGTEKYNRARGIKVHPGGVFGKGYYGSIADAVKYLARCQKNAIRKCRRD